MTVWNGERSIGLSDDHDAFRGVFETHREAVFRFLYRLSGNRHDAEDLLQETFARLWSKRAQFRGDGSLAGYLRRIAYHTYLNARPKIVRHKTAAQGPDRIDPQDNPADNAAREDLEAFLLRRVREAVDNLPESWREPFLLFRYEGLKLREIAEIMGVTPKAVEIRVARALRRIADELKELRAEYGAARDGQ